MATYQLACGGHSQVPINRAPEARLLSSSERTHTNRAAEERRASPNTKRDLSKTKKKSSSRLAAASASKEGSMARIAAAHAFLRDLCSPGSFVVLAKQLLFPLALLDIAVTWCTVGFSKRIYGLTGVRAAVAGGSHLLLCVVSFSVLLQATLAAGTLFVIRNKRSIGELPAATRRWCRRAIFVAFILHTIAILCFVVFATALVGGSKFMFVAMEVIAWPIILAFCFIGSYMAMYAH